MILKSKLLTIVMAVFIFVGCDAHHEKLIAPYLLVAPDTLEQTSLSYDLGDGNSIGRVDSTVFAVGWNEHYIVAKQHPKNNRTVTNFYYLEISKDSKNADPTNSVVGPLTETEFIKKQTELKLPIFTRIIKTLE
jgi:hypothetical protein